MKLLILVGIILGIITFGQTAPPQDDSQVKQFADGMENFSYKWSKVASKISNNENFMTSGTCASFTLAMLYMGANGNTKEEIKKALNLPESDDIIKNIMKRINEGLDKPRKIDLKIANRIFTKSGIEIKQEFKDITNNVFRAEAASLDFSNKPDEASKTINEWVDTKTNNHIKNLVSSDDVKDSSMVLVNAVYFNGKWKTPFKGQNMAPFYLNDKDIKNVTTMHGHGQFMHGDLIGVDAKYVVLPYESDKEQFSMFLIVPNEITGLKNIENNMENVKWEEAIKGGKIKNLHIDMPKFKLESTMDLEIMLKEMGMNDMFSDKADFTGISSQQLQITKAIQKSFINVDEKGTEATAATSVIAGVTSAHVHHEEPEIHVSINRPFLFSILMAKDNVKNLFFYGRCVDPKSE